MSCHHCTYHNAMKSNMYSSFNASQYYSTMYYYCIASIVLSSPFAGWLSSCSHRVPWFFSAPVPKIAPFPRIPLTSHFILIILYLHISIYPQSSYYYIPVLSYLSQCKPWRSLAHSAPWSLWGRQSRCPSPSAHSRGRPPPSRRARGSSWTPGRWSTTSLWTTTHDPSRAGGWVRPLAPEIVSHLFMIQKYTK